MKKILILIFTGILLVSLISCSTTTTDDSDSTSAETTSADYDGLFEDNDSRVIDIYIDIDEDELQDMFDNAIDEEYHEATITVDGITLENVGIRTKGASSLMSVASSDSDRYGFKIKTDKYVDDQTLNGLDKFVLNASFSDPSYMREYLTYVTASDFGLTTPNLIYTNVYFNDELFGFYLCVESYSDSFVERVTDNDESAVLYKADSDNCNLATTDDTTGFEVKYGEDENNANIENLITVLNNTTADNTSDLEAILDVDSVLKNIALNTVLGNYDSYSGSKAHNYYLLYTDGKFEYLGWDYNMSLGGFAEDNGLSVNVDVETPIYKTTLEDRPLIDVLLSIDEYNTRYLEYIDTLTDYLNDFQSTVDDLATLISPYVEEDPTAFYDYDTYLANITASDVDLTAVSTTTSNMARPGLANANNTTELPDDAELPDGELPAIPDDAELPDGELANAQAGQIQRPQGGNLMNQNAISSDTVSIIDYITQRLAVIAEQLAE